MWSMCGKFGDEGVALGLRTCIDLVVDWHIART